ncbi:MAG: general secretion pathway protein GspB [Vibrionaceae bacterium]|nr:general secretion pathway protein GspB [Vibrionaceae bacterium]
MSKVLKALAHSEQGYQAASLSSSYPVSQQANTQPRVSKSSIIFLIFAPAIVASAVSTFQIYQSKIDGWKANQQAETITVDVPFVYNVKAYPSFRTLQATYELESALNQELPVVAASETPLTQQQPTAQTSKEPLFNDIDLSQLSPELALRVEAALGASDTVDEVSASNLSNDAVKWRGKLPAMNFETHVYSSNPSKRWVKVNGNEYIEGDWITDRVRLVKIEQQSCQISFNGETIQVPALYEWKG